MNMKIIRTRNEVEMKIQGLQKALAEAKQHLFNTQKLLMAKEEESACQKSKLSLLENNDGKSQTIEHLTEQLEMKEAMIQLMEEETKFKEGITNGALFAQQRALEDRNLIFDQIQRVKMMLHISRMKEQEAERTKKENDTLAAVMRKHEELEVELHR
jgi:hypothetical protein